MMNAINNSNSANSTSCNNYLLFDNLSIQQYLNSIKDRLNEQYKKYPILTKSITSAFLYGLSAAVGTQLAHKHNINHDKRKVGYYYHRTATRTSSSSSSSRSISSGGIDWYEVLSFAFYGGVIGGPIGHYWDTWYEYHGPESETYSMLLDQMIGQPPRLIVQFVVFDIVRAIVHDIIPNIYQNSIKSEIPQMIVTSWRYWPVSIYIMLRLLKKRKHYMVGMNFCSFVWMAYLAKQRKLSQLSTSS